MIFPTCSGGGQTAPECNTCDLLRLVHLTITWYFPKVLISPPEVKSLSMLVTGLQAQTKISEGITNNDNEKQSRLHKNAHFEGILPKGPYPPCLRMADRALLAGYPRFLSGGVAWYISLLCASHLVRNMSGKIFAIAVPADVMASCWIG